jgi:hypothetical protein
MSTRKALAKVGMERMSGRRAENADVGAEVSDLAGGIV